MPEVSIVIANYNGEKFLPECLTSVLRSSYRNFEVVVVDDGSKDESQRVIDKFARRDRRVKLICNVSNLGAAATRNVALGSCRGQVMVFLDNDTRVEKEWLRELVAPLLTKDPTLAATCSKTLVYQRPKIISTAGLQLIPHTGWGIARGGMAKDGVRVWDKPAETVAISASLAVRREAIEKIGGFDEKLAVHTEDLDFCWRLWLAGYRIAYIPSSRVYHWSKSQSQRAKLMAATKSFVYFHINKNTLRTLLKNYSLLWLLKYLPWALAIIIGRGLIVLFLRHDPTALIAAVKALVWNLFYLPDTLQTRWQIQRQRRVSDQYLYDKIMSHESLWDIYRKHYV